MIKTLKKLFSQLFPSLICQRTAPLCCDGENEYISFVKKCQELNRVFLFFFMNISTGDAQKKNAEWESIRGCIEGALALSHKKN